jgi:hypothetical protein
MKQALSPSPRIVIASGSSEGIIRNGSGTNGSRHPHTRFKRENSRKQPVVEVPIGAKRVYIRDCWIKSLVLSSTVHTVTIVNCPHLSELRFSSRTLRHVIVRDCLNLRWITVTNGCRNLRLEVRNLPALEEFISPTDPRALEEVTLRGCRLALRHGCTLTARRALIVPLLLEHDVKFNGTAIGVAEVEPYHGAQILLSPRSSALVDTKGPHCGGLGHWYTPETLLA